MRTSGSWLVALALASSGCRACAEEPTASKKDAEGPSTAACTQRTTERLGIPFVKVCPQDLASIGAAFEPFWIAAAPLGCSAGEHEELRCPSVVGLEHPAVGESRTPRVLESRLAAVVDANVAQTVCFMRFAGRLATREERARAEAAMGMASVMVAQQGTHFDYVTLGEWVTDAPCTTTTAEGCGAARYPSGSRAPIPWGALASCKATPLAAGATTPLLAIGEGCPAPEFAWTDASATLPCAMRSPAGRPSVVGFSLSCRPPVGERHPDDDVEKTAAFRCVIPEVAILTGPDAAP